MEEKIRKISAVTMAVLSLIVTITVLGMPFVFAEEEQAELAASEEDNTERMSGLELMDYYTSQMEEQEETLDYQMKIELPPDVEEADVKVVTNEIQQLVTITIPGIEEEYFYEHPLLGSSDHIDNLMIGCSGNKGVIEITLDQVYEVQKNVEDSWLCMDFVPPQELYDKVIVIDAGHGGSAPGAVKQGVYEKDLNLAIVLELKSLLDAHENWKVYYTRTGDTGPTLDERVQLANKSQANLFISVHNNSTKDGQMSDYNGTEVMFDEEKSEEDMGTKQLAQICLEESVAVMGSKNLGLIKGHSIYIIRTSQVPVALIEVGFMTNEEELAKLNSSEYQKQAAQGIYNGIVRALEEGY